MGAACVAAAPAGAWSQARPAPTPTAEAAAPGTSANSALDAQLFYQLLAAELEWRQGRAAVAFEVVLDAARRTKHPELFQRAVDMALQARAADRGLAAARAWRAAHPEALEPVRLQLQILSALNRPAEAAEPLRFLIARTPADGLVMGTRTGSIDPGVLVALMRDEHLSLDQLEDLLYRKSGLLGLSGISPDMRVLLSSDRTEAIEAVDYYCYSAARHAASLVPALGGVDAMVFTGGVGENAGPVRARILSHLKWLNVPMENVHVVPANEELTIARNVRALL